MIDILIINCLSDNYSYLIKDKKTNLVGVIDPSNFREVDQKVSKTYKKLDFILNTHHHSDHVGGNIDLKKKYNSKIICSSYESDKIPDADIKKSDGEKFAFGEINFEVLHIPGHTLGHIAFYSEKANIIFTGDTLFSLGCGRIFEGDHKQMLASLNKIKKLPRDTKIYCGHEYTYKNAEFCMKHDRNNQDLKKNFEEIKNLRSQNLPTIPSCLEDEIKSNIFLRCDQKDLKIKLNMKNQEDSKVFKKVRDLKDSF